MPNIGKLEARGDIAGLVKALSHRRAGVAEKAERALGRVGDSQTVDVLLKVLQTTQLDNADGRRVADRVERILGDIGDRAVEPLLQALEDETVLASEPIVDVVVGALGAIGDDRAVEPLLRLLSEETTFEHNASSLVRALGGIGDARAADKLVHLLILGYELSPLYGQVDVSEPRVAATTRAIRQNVARALGRVGDVDAIKALKAALQFGLQHDEEWHPVTEIALMEMEWKRKEREVLITAVNEITARMSPSPAS